MCQSFPEPPRSLPVLLHRENTTPGDRNLLGKVWRTPARTGREIKTLTQDGSRGNFGLLILESEDEARHANSLQTFKGKL